MDKNFIKLTEDKLKTNKKSLEVELHKFAKKDANLKGDWDTNYPKFNGGAGSQLTEESADEVEEYSNLLPVEHNLELRLKKINSALDKIKGGNYGKCEKCGKDIDEKKLEIYPEAEFCNKCRK